MKLLIVEDNERLVDDIRDFLREHGYVVEYAMDAATAHEKVFLYEYDLVIVDLGLPDGDGLDLIREMKENEIESGILILTAKDSVEDKVEGLHIGADDYMAKPFHKEELNARIHSILRRHKFNSNNTLEIGEIRVDFLSSQAYVGDRSLELTKKEYDLLVYFLQNPDRLITKESIAEHLWGDHIDQSDSFDFVYNHIKNLRKKIQKAGGDDPIQSKYGMGYKFASEQA